MVHPYCYILIYYCKPPYIINHKEGYQNCMDDIWEKAKELRSWTEHDGSISATDIEAGLQEAYLEIGRELDKLTTK